MNFFKLINSFTTQPIHEAPIQTSIIHKGPQTTAINALQVDVRTVQEVKILADQIGHLFLTDPEKSIAFIKSTNVPLCESGPGPVRSHDVPGPGRLLRRSNQPGFEVGG